MVIMLVLEPRYFARRDISVPSIAMLQDVPCYMYNAAEIVQSPNTPQTQCLRYTISCYLMSQHLIEYLIQPLLA